MLPIAVQNATKTFRLTTRTRASIDQARALVRLPQVASRLVNWNEDSRRWTHSQKWRPVQVLDEYGSPISSEPLRHVS